VIDAGLIDPERAAALQQQRDAIAAFRRPSLDQTFDLRDGWLEAGRRHGIQVRDLEKYGESPGNGRRGP